MAKIIIVDGNSLLFRAYYALYNIDKDKLMHSKDGTPTNAIFAFSNMLVSLLNQLNKGDGIFVAFDKGAKTFRHKTLESYKANRPPCPEDLIVQFPIARELLDSLNILYYEADDYEADDIAGNMAKLAEKAGYKVQIYTSDKDYLQLINENISIKLIKKGLKDIHEMNSETFKEEWGFEPKYIPDFKGLNGDSSDNLKGIPKIGEKTAKTLISTYGSFEEIFNHVDELKPAISKSFKENFEQGKISKELAIIQTDFDLPYSPSETVYQGYSFDVISNFCSKYSFQTLLNKLSKSLRIQNETLNKIEVEEDVDPTKLTIPNEFGFSIDITDENYHDAELLGFAISFNNKNYYFSTNNPANLNYFKEILENKDNLIYCYDFKKIKCVLSRYGINVKRLKFDLLLASYLIDPSIKNDLNSVLSYFSIDINYAYENSISLFSTNNPLLTGIEAHYSYSLYNKIINKLKELNQLELLLDIEQPLTIVLADMEIEGFPVDKNYLVELGNKYKKNIEEISKDIYFYAGKEFNINSPKELAEVLYDDLKLKTNKKRSTSIEYLKELLNEHPIIYKILEYRKYSKLLSTYVNGILPYIKEDNLIHATFNQALTQTGRLSSSEPNLQNITVRDEESKQIRKAFYYKDEALSILSLDYSQIELRVLASLSNATSLINTFNHDKDIHSETAKKIFHLDREPTSLERRKAKAVNFGIIYGISDWGLAEQLEIPVKEAKEIIISFNNAFPEIKEYLDSIIEDAKNKGYSSTLFNRRRYLPDLNSSNYQLREFSKRAAMNAPIQGSAADIIKIAMIKVGKALKENNLKSKLVNQIHDELILKLYEDEKEKVYNLVKNIMETCVSLKVCLKVEGGYAKTWFDAK